MHVPLTREPLCTAILADPNHKVLFAAIDGSTEALTAEQSQLGFKMVLAQPLAAVPAEGAYACAALACLALSVLPAWRHFASSTWTCSRMSPFGRPAHHRMHTGFNTQCLLESPALCSIHTTAQLLPLHTHAGVLLAITVDGPGSELCAIPDLAPVEGLCNVIIEGGTDANAAACCPRSLSQVRHGVSGPHRQASICDALLRNVVLPPRCCRPCHSTMSCQLASSWLTSVTGQHPGHARAITS